MIKCPDCQSEHIRKNGINHQGKQNYICVHCSRQFIDRRQRQRGYSEQIRHDCLKMYVNGMGFRAIERVKGVHHTTIMKWVKQDRYFPAYSKLYSVLDIFVSM